MLCYSPPVLISLHEIEGKYPREFSDENDSLTDQLKELQDKYNAWIEIEILPYVGNTDVVPDGYAFTGKIASELLNDKAFAVFLPDRNELFPYSIKIREALAGSNPCEALDFLSRNINE